MSLSKYIGYRLYRNINRFKIVWSVGDGRLLLCSITRLFFLNIHMYFISFYPYYWMEHEKLCMNQSGFFHGHEVITDRFRLGMMLFLKSNISFYM